MSPNKFYLCLELFQAISCLQGALLFTNIFNLICVVSCFPLTVLVVQWSAYVSYTPTIWVRLLLTSKSCFWFLVRNDENKSKEVEVRPLLNCFEMSEKFFLSRLTFWQLTWNFLLATKYLIFRMTRIVCLCFSVSLSF